MTERVAEERTQDADLVAAVPVVNAARVAPNRRRGGDIRVLLSPKTAHATSGFMGVLELAEGEWVSEHYHPYSEEFLYVVRGALRLRLGLDNARLIDLGPGDSIMIPPGIRHRLENGEDGDAFCVFHLSPLAPRPDLGHVDTEPLPDPAAPPLAVGVTRERE